VTLISVHARRCDSPRFAAKASHDASARSSFFCIDVLHHLDLQIALGHQLLQPRILCLELLQAANIVGLERPKPLAPRIDRNFNLRMLPFEPEGNLSSNGWSEITGGAGSSPSGMSASTIG
jgi:hypothetical protein